MVSVNEDKEKKITYFIRAIMLAVCIILTSGMILPVPIDPTARPALPGRASQADLIASLLLTRRYSGRQSLGKA